MHDEHGEHQVPIWFFIGLILSVYGLLILGYGLIFGAPTDVQLANLRADLWWGGLLLVLGLVYVVKFRPAARR